jgi:hypothetical protein
MNSDSTDVPPGGGTVEPVASSKGKDRGAKSPRPASERFELRDPFSEVTYRAETIEEIAIHAERLGATRFHAVAADGKKTAVVKVDGEWQRREPVVEPQRKEVARDPDALRVPSLVVDAGSKPPPVDKSGLSAEQAEHVERLEAALHERYVIKRGFAALGDAAVSRTVYRYRGDIGRVAFTESSSRLSTDSNNPSVARSMVDVAELRNWHSIRVSGHEDFKRAVWLEASLRGRPSGMSRSASTLNCCAGRGRRGKSTESNRRRNLPPARQASNRGAAAGARPSSRPSMQCSLPSGCLPSNAKP